MPNSTTIHRRNQSNKYDFVTRFTVLEEKPPDGFTWSGSRLRKKQSTSRPDYSWSEMSEAAQQRKEKHKWAIENPKLDNAGRLRGGYFIDPDGEEFKQCLARP